MLRRLLCTCGVLAAFLALAPVVVVSWVIGWSFLTKRPPSWLVLAQGVGTEATTLRDDETLRFDVTIPAEAASSYELGHGAFIARMESQPVVICIRRAQPQTLTAAAPPPTTLARQ